MSLEQPPKTCTGIIVTEGLEPVFRSFVNSFGVSVINYDDPVPRKRTRLICSRPECGSLSVIREGENQAGNLVPDIYLLMKGLNLVCGPWRFVSFSNSTNGKMPLSFLSCSLLTRLFDL